MPTLQQIKDRVYNDFVVSFQNVITPLKKSFFEILSNSISASVHLLYLYLDNVKKNSFLHSCTQDRVTSYFAPLLGLSLKEATVSTGIARFTGVDTTTIPSGTKIIYNGSIEFITIGAGVITGGIADIQCTSSKTGTLNNTINNISLSLVVPIAGVDNIVVSTLGFLGAIDPETIESLRGRCITKQGKNPQIDNNNYYKTLALEVPNVRAAFISELKNGGGTFGVTILTNSNNGVPVQSDINAVEAYFIQQNGVPTYALAEYFIPTIIYQNLNILLAVESEENKTFIEQLAKDYIYRFQEPGTPFKFLGLSKILQANGARLSSPLPTATISLQLDEVLDIGSIFWI